MFQVSAVAIRYVTTNPGTAQRIWREIYMICGYDPQTQLLTNTDATQCYILRPHQTGVKFTIMCFTDLHCSQVIMINFHVFP